MRSWCIEVLLTLPVLAIGLTTIPKHTHNISVESPSVRYAFIHIPSHRGQVHGPGNDFTAVYQYPFEEESQTKIKCQLRPEGKTWLLTRG